jgi:uncharacterized membrane protein YhiD involved in acid resistance
LGVAVTLLTLIALIGLKAGERRMRKDWFEDLEIVSTDLPGQITLMKSLIVQHGFEVIGSGLRRDAEKKELKATFQVRVRAVLPQREILQDLIELEGVKEVNLS